MRVALSLWFDEQLEGRVREVWGQLSSNGIDSPLYDGRFRPHVTVGVWETESLERLTDDAAAWAKKTAAFHLQFRSIGLFPGDEGVVFLSPIVDHTLLAAHEELSTLTSRHGTLVSLYYRLGVWIPHCTLAWQVAPKQCIEAARICMSCGCLPLEGKVTAVGIIKTPSEVELKRLPLGCI